MAASGKKGIQGCLERFLLLALLHSLQDLSSPTRECTWVPGSESSES